MRRMTRIGPACLALILNTTVFHNSVASDGSFRSVPSKTFSIIPTDQSGVPSAQSAFRGAITLDWQKKERFGGFSGLHVDWTGKHLTTISDRGAWFTGYLDFIDGRLIAIRKAGFKRLRGPDGEKLKRRDGDAEALSSDGAGGFVVAFERHHSLLRYPGWRRPFHLRARQWTLPSDVQRLPANKGLEATTRLCDGRYLVISQRGQASTEGGETQISAWIGNDGKWAKRMFSRRPGVGISGAATLSDCSVVLIERERHSDGRWRTGILRISSNRFAPDDAEPMTAQDMLGPFLAVEKFEGIAAHPLNKGRERILLIADNDFEGATLLVAFVAKLM
jgi:hypothetical protein